MEITKILICVDEPEFAREIVHTACFLLGKKQTEITLLNIIETNAQDSSYFFEAPQKYLEHESEKSNFADLENFIEEQGFNYKGFIYKEGDPARTIIDMQKNDKYDLVVVGTHNKKFFERLLLGSVSYKVSRYCTSSVLIVKHSSISKKDCSGSYNVLLGADGSDCSAFCENNIGKYLDYNRALITVLNVKPSIQEILPSDAYVYTDLEKIMDEIRMSSDKILRMSTVNVMRQKFEVVQKIKLEGDAALNIINTAQNSDFDLIAIGSHGKSGFSEWLMGSVSFKIAEKSNVPVLIVRQLA